MPKVSFEKRVLVVDDDSLMREFLREFFLQKGILVDIAVDGVDALNKVLSRDYLFVLADLRMPGLNGLELLDKIKQLKPSIPVIIITAYGTISSAIEATKMGAFDYITKPVSPEELEVRTKKALEYAQIIAENEELKLRLFFDECRIIGVSPAMQRIMRTVEAVAGSKANVLIEGESGTGKELIAKALHRLSPRADKPFVKVNCAAIPETILEAELFGTVKGAFTGATDREGKFEAAHTGTILLDEISETSIPFQAKILRVIQEMEIERIGSTKPIKIDVRVVATTNKSLKNEVRKGRFREDLYYRLNVIPIHIPPLRKRKSDIPSLVRYFVNRYSIEACKKPPIIEQDAIEVLVNYPWYGNVRELENFINRLIVTSNRDIIDKKAVIAALETPVNNDYGTHTAESNEIPTLYEVEKNLILKALELTAGNKIKAAKLLGITQRTIYNKLKKYEEEGIKIQKDGKIIES